MYKVLVNRLMFVEIIGCLRDEYFAKSIDRLVRGILIVSQLNGFFFNLTGFLSRL